MTDRWRHHVHLVNRGDELREVSEARMEGAHHRACHSGYRHRDAADANRLSYRLESQLDDPVPGERLRSAQVARLLAIGLEEIGADFGQISAVDRIGPDRAVADLRDKRLSPPDRETERTR